MTTVGSGPGGVAGSCGAIPLLTSHASTLSGLAITCIPIQIGFSFEHNYPIRTSYCCQRVIHRLVRRKTSSAKAGILGQKRCTQTQALCRPARQTLKGIIISLSFESPSSIHNTHGIIISQFSKLLHSFQTLLRYLMKNSVFASILIILQLILIYSKIFHFKYFNFFINSSRPAFSILKNS